MKKRIISLVAVMAILYSCIPNITHAEVLESGYCGKDGSSLTWTLDDEGTLTISGKGPMKSYNYQAGSVNTPFPKSKVKTVVIEDGVSVIGNYAFCLCDNLTSVIMADSVTSIGKYAFYKCSSLTDITLSKNINGIDEFAFDDTAYLNNDSNWEDGALYIDKYLICTDYDKISSDYTIKEGTTLVARYAFGNCNITSLTVPSSVEVHQQSTVEMQVLDNFFYEIPDTLSKVTIEANEVPNDFANGCTNIARVNISDNVSAIGKDAFKGCTNLRFLTLGQGLKKISQNAFDGCSNIAEITLPPSLQTIEQNAFNNCYSLDKIVIPESVTSIVGDGVFPKRTVIYGYRGSAAQEYAENYGYTFKEVDADEYITASNAERINDTIVISTSVKSDISKNILHIALYDNNNTLVDYMLVPTKKSKDNAYVVFKNNPNVSYAKVYIWDSMKTMTPTAKAEKVVIQ